MAVNKYEDLGKQDENEIQANTNGIENGIKHIDCESAAISTVSNTEKSALIKKGLPSLGLTVEPIEFCTGFALAITSGVSIDMIERRVCLQRFNQTVEDCVSSSSLVKSNVEEITANINMAIQIVQGAIPLLLSILIGPWSDSNGRKPFVLISIQGYTVYYLLWGLMSLFPNIPVIYLVLPSVCISATGGSIALHACLTSYMCDVFHDKERIFRLTLKNCFNTAGIIVANLMAPAIKSRWPVSGYTIVFFTSTIMSAISAAYTTFYLKETVDKNENKRTKLFEWKNFKSMFVALLCKPKIGLLSSILILTVVTAEVTSTLGNDNITYLVTKSQYSWSLHDYSLFKAVNSAVSASLPLLVLWLLHKLFSISDLILVLVCAVVILIMELIKGFVLNDNVFFAAQCFIDNFGRIFAPAVDVLLSSIVTQEDLGKACAFLSFVVATSPVISQPIYTELYKYLLRMKRATYVYLLSAGFNFIITACTIILMLKSKFGGNRAENNS